MPAAPPLRRSGNRRAAITMTVIALLLFGTFWYAYSYYRADVTGKHTSASASPTRCVDPAAPGLTTVNVYNASGRAKLAATTSKLIAARGYTIGEVANDASHRQFTAPAEVRYGIKGAAKAKRVQQLIKGSVLVKDTRTSQTVSVSLGAAFTGLAPRLTDQRPSGTCAP